ncbi:unnamed protein product, partial [Rotaria sp. Silwood1]
MQSSQFHLLAPLHNFIWIYQVVLII